MITNVLPPFYGSQCMVEACAYHQCRFGIGGVGNVCAHWSDFRLINNSLTRHFSIIVLIFADEATCLSWFACPFVSLSVSRITQNFMDGFLRNFRERQGTIDQTQVTW